MRALLLLLITLGALTGLAPTASAHAELLGTTPSNGEHLATAPTEIVLRFSENVTPVRDGFTVLAANGREVAAAQGEVVGGTRVRLPVSGLDNGVYSVTFNAGGDLLATTGEDHKTRLYDVSHLDNPVLLSTMEGNTDRNYHVTFQPGDHYLVTAGGDGTARFWNIDNRRAPRTGPVLTHPTGRVTWVEFSPDG
ncbi:copper resistance protein CopC, partial [Kibdelosporangium lantanae]